MRIRWRGVARAAAIVVVGLIALRLLPALMRAPEPPPLGADVGLPQAKPERVVAKREPQPPRQRPRQENPRRRRRKPRPRRRVSVVPDQPASKAVIGTRKKDRRPPPPPAESAPPAVPEYVPPPAPEPTPVPVPEPAPTPLAAPGDGSEEFAPH